VAVTVLCGRYCIIGIDEEVAAFTRAHHHRFVGIAGTNLLDPIKAVTEVEKYVKRDNFKGLREAPWQWNLNMTQTVEQLAT
jgi:uncharacterized protein